MTEMRREVAFVERRSGDDRRYQPDRRNNWKVATALLQRDLMDDLLTLEREMRQAIAYPDSLDYWANELAAVIRRHQEP